MVYSDLIRIAMNIAYIAHDGQVDKGGYPYINHPLFLATQMDTEIEVVTALLHDVTGCTPISLDDIKQAGIPGDALEALKFHNMDINRCNQDEDAIKRNKKIYKLCK